MIIFIVDPCTSKLPVLDKIALLFLQDPLVLYGQQVTPENCKRKYAFQLSGSRCDVLLAAESSEKQRQWMTALGLASIGYQVRNFMYIFSENDSKDIRVSIRSLTLIKTQP